MGLVLGCYVSAANVADVKAAPGCVAKTAGGLVEVEFILTDRTH